MSQLQRLRQEQVLLDEATKEIKDFVSQLVDAQSFVESNAFLAGVDRLDGQPIVGEGVLCGTAVIGGAPVVVIAQNSAALFGSFGSATADKIAKALDLAIRNDLPVVSVLDSSGARVGEGASVLDGYGLVLQKVAQTAQFNPHIAILKGQTVGLMDVYASLCTMRIALPDATLCVGAPKVASAVDNQDATAYAAKTVAKQGAVDFLCQNVGEIRHLLVDSFAWFGGSRQSADDPNRESEQLVSSVEGDALFAALLDDGNYLEFRALCAPALRCAMGYVNGTAVGAVVATGELDTLCAAKLGAFLGVLALRGTPLVSLVNSVGFADKDQAALSQALATLVQNLGVIDNKIAVSVGDAIGNAFSLLASKGLGYAYSMAFATACISPLALPAAAQLMYRDQLHQAGNTPEVQQKLQQLYAAEHCDAFAAAKEGYIDAVIHPATLRPYVASVLSNLL